jgi:hypothetical protein
MPKEKREPLNYTAYKIVNRTGLPDSCFDALRTKLPRFGEHSHSNKGGDVCHMIGSPHFNQVRDETTFIIRLTTRAPIMQDYEFYNRGRLQVGERQRFVVAARTYGAALWDGYHNTLSISWGDSLQHAQQMVGDTAKAWAHEYDVSLYGEDNPGNR